MRRAAIVMALVSISAATSCAAILGDEFTIDNDGDGDDDDSSSSSSSGECSETACNDCGLAQCDAELTYCVEVGCNEYFACLNGEIGCDFGTCDDCWPYAYDAATIAGTCICQSCPTECCQSCGGS